MTIQVYNGMLAMIAITTTCTYYMNAVTVQ